ncbi:MAG: GNAT family N-acetyltransferase [Lachnospiraceae bacterium]|nr:GNAT family N-acetyltransferase [Lachnospiraceae bacterium]
MEWKIRKAVKEDENRIKELFIEMLQTIYSSKNVNGYEDGYLDKFFDDCDDWICVAEVNGFVVAYLSIEVHHEQETFIYLDDLSVSEEYRNNGIGTKLIKAAERFARETDISTILFHVEKSNIAAFRLYERLGYSVMNDEGTQFRMIKRSF